MENARAILSNKTSQPITDPVNHDPSLEENNVIILEEDAESEFDDFMLVTPRRSRKPVKNLDLASQTKKKNPCATSNQNTKNKEISCDTSK
jgi:hypothetical protein